jgi:hypothetical protein
MRRSGWVLVPQKDVALVVDRENRADVEPWDYPWVGFPDGEVEGSDLNKLWLLVCGSPAEKPMWGTPFRDGPDGSEKIAPVRPSVAEAFAALPDSRIRELVASWQQADSETSSLPWWELEDVVEAVRGLKFLAQQYSQLRPGWELLMVWFV